MAYKDLREWISKLESEGELKRITVEVDWDTEIGAIMHEVFSQKGPAIIFENIKDYKNSFCSKLFTGSIAIFPRIALMYGLPKETTISQLVKITKELMDHPIKPILVKSGPVKENKIYNDKINLFDLPVPKWHPEDGGRYINTFCGIVTADPDTGEENIGLYRGLIGSKNTIPSALVRVKHWGNHYYKCVEKGIPMPVAIVYGGDPLIPYVASIPIPSGICEYDVIGGIRKEPLELVKCETSDLRVPAAAEIILEGFISPDPETYEMEGPFGEYTGYFGEVRSKRPTIQVECITYQKDPIFTGTRNETIPGVLAEGGTIASVSQAALAWNILESQGIPGILDVCVTPVTSTTNIFIKIQKSYRGQAKQIAAALWGSGAAHTRYKNVMVVDEDIDVYNYEALDWAFAYRVNAAENDLVVFPGCSGSIFDPSTRLEDRNALKYGTGKWNRLLIDATINWDYPKRPEWGNKIYPPLNQFQEKVLETVRKRWKEYGL
jgi:4-hydroxy-3-polyprenylbenzoate decarboxylase